MKKRLLWLFTILFCLVANAQEKGKFEESTTPANNGFHILQVTESHNNAIFLLGIKNKKMVLALFDADQMKWFDIPLPYPDANVLSIVEHDFVTLVALVHENDGNKLYHWRRNKWVRFSAPSLDGRIYSLEPLGTAIDFMVKGDFKSGSDSFHYAKFIDGKWQKHTLEGAAEEVRDLLTFGEIQRSFLANRFHIGLLVRDPRTNKHYALWYQRKWQLMGPALPGPVDDILSDVNTYVCGKVDGETKAYFVKDSADSWKDIDLGPSPIVMVQKILTLGNDSRGAIVNGISKDGSTIVTTGIIYGKWLGSAVSPGTISQNLNILKPRNLMVTRGDRYLVRTYNKEKPISYVVIPEEMETPTNSVLEMRTQAKKKL